MALNAAELQITVTADTSQAQAEMNNVEGMISGVLIGNQIKNFGEDALGFVGDFISVGATFEEQMTLIDRIIGGTVSHLDQLKQKAIDADVRTMFDAFEVTKGMEMLARAGFDAMEIIGTPGQNNGIIDAVLNFAGATAESTEVAGRSFAAVARIFQNSGVSMIDLADLLTAAVLRSGKSASEFMTAFQYVGSIASNFGTAPEDIATVIALMEQLGIRSMTVGQSLRSMYTAFSTDRATIEGMGISLYTVNDAGKEVLRTLPDIIEQFHTLVSGMNPDAALAMLTDIFGKPAASALMTLFTTGAENMDDFKASMDDVNDSQSIMDARMNTLRGSLEKFNATWLGLKKVLGDSVSGFIKPIVDGATFLVDLLQNAPTPVLQATAALIALAGALAWIGGSMILINALTGGKGLGWLIGQSFRIALPALMPFALGLLAIGAAALLVKSNFGGVKDYLTSLDDKWDEFKERFHEGMVYGTAKKIIKGHARQDAAEVEQLYTGTYMTVANALAAIRDMGGPNLLGMWKALWPHVKEVGDGLGVIGRTYERLSNVIKKHGLAEGMRQLFKGDIGKDFLKGIGDVLSEGPRLLGTFLRNFDTGSTRINGILKNFGSAFQLFGTVIESVFDGDWSKAWDAYTRSIQRLVRGGIGVGSVLVDIAGWLFNSGKDLYNELKIWIMGKINGTSTSGAATGFGRPFSTSTDAPSLVTVLVGIADWAFTSAVNLYDRLKGWIYGSLGGKSNTPGAATGFGRPLAGDGPIPLGKITVLISEWAVTTVTNLWDAIKKKVYGWFGGSGARMESDGGFAGSLAAGAADPAHTISLGQVALKIQDWAITAWDGSLGESIWNKIIDLVTSPIEFNQLDMNKANDLGEKLGKPLGKLFAKGIELATGLAIEFIKGSGDDTETIYDPVSGKYRDMIKPPKFDMNNLLSMFLQGFFQGFDDGADEVFDPYKERLRKWWGQKWNSLLNIFTTDGDSGFAGVGPGSPVAKRDFSFTSIIKGILNIDQWAIDELGLPDFKTQFSRWLSGQFTELNTYLSNNPTVIALAKLMKGDFAGAYRALTGQEVDNVMANPNGDPALMPFDPRWETEVPTDWQVWFSNTPWYKAYLNLVKDVNKDSMYEPRDRYRAMPTTPAPSTAEPQGFIDPLPRTVSSKTSEAGKILSTFASSVPFTMSGFKSSMERVANEAMSRFQSSLGTGMLGGTRIAAFGAQAIAIAAKPRDLYNDGFNVGYRLGQGMAAGMMATIGQIAAARQTLELTATGENAKSDPFNGGNSTASVPPKQPQVVNQTNHITMSVTEVEELVTAANFVGNLDRGRQIALGRA